VAFADDLSGLHVEGGEQRDRAVTRIVVRAPFQLSGTHREQRLGAVQGLDLALLLYFLDEQRILREFECFAAVRLEGEGAPMRFTVLRLSPDAAASDRVDSWSARVGLPHRSPCATKRCRHLPTVWILT
jgi:hypothetical protein